MPKIKFDNLNKYSNCPPDTVDYRGNYYDSERWQNTCNILLQRQQIINGLAEGIKKVILADPKEFNNRPSCSYGSESKNILMTYETALTNILQEHIVLEEEYLYLFNPKTGNPCVIWYLGDIEWMAYGRSPSAAKLQQYADEQEIPRESESGQFPEYAYDAAKGIVVEKIGERVVRSGNRLYNMGSSMKLRGYWRPRTRKFYGEARKKAVDLIKNKGTKFQTTGTFVKKMGIKYLKIAKFLGHFDVLALCLTPMKMGDGLTPQQFATQENVRRAKDAIARYCEINDNFNQ